VAGGAPSRPGRAHPHRDLSLIHILAIIAGVFAHSLLYSSLFEDPMVWVALGVGAAYLVRPQPTSRVVVRP